MSTVKTTAIVRSLVMSAVLDRLLFRSSRNKAILAMLRSRTPMTCGICVQDLASGTVAGAAQLLCGHPFDTVKLKLQTQAKPLPGEVPRYSGAIDAARKVTNPGSLSIQSLTNAVEQHYVQLMAYVMCKRRPHFPHVYIMSTVAVKCTEDL